MTVVYSPDGQQVSSVHGDSFRGHWVPDPDRGMRFVRATPANGFYPLIVADRPDDTDEGTCTYSVERVGDEFHEKWTRRPWTERELASRMERQSPDLAEVVAARLVAADNENPRPWEADRHYLPGAMVLDPDTGHRHRNDLGVVNVWPLTERHARWTDIDAVEPVGPQKWQPFNGFPETIYAFDAEVTWDHPDWPQYHVWKSKIPNNVQEPGADGLLHRWWKPIG